MMQPTLFRHENAPDDKGIGRRARTRYGELVKRKAALGELNMQTLPIYAPSGSPVRLREIRQGVKGAALGMTVQPPKKSPYDNLAARMEAGAKEQGRLEQHGEAMYGEAARRAQRRIPRTTPVPAPRISRQGA